MAKLPLQEAVNNLQRFKPLLQAVIDVADSAGDVTKMNELSTEAEVRLREKSDQEKLLDSGIRQKQGELARLQSEAEYASVQAKAKIDAGDSTAKAHIAAAKQVEAEMLADAKRHAEEASAKAQRRLDAAKQEAATILAAAKLQAEEISQTVTQRHKLLTDLNERIEAKQGEHTEWEGKVKTAKAHIKTLLQE